jgi:hypothetical protein
MALMKVPFDAGKAKPGMPIFVKPFMTAAAFGIDCFKGKVGNSILIVESFC